LAILMGTVGGIVAIVRGFLREGWGALGPALLANWGLAAGIILAVAGPVVRMLLRTWLRQKLRALLTPLAPSSSAFGHPRPGWPHHVRNEIDAPLFPNGGSPVTGLPWGM